MVINSHQPGYGGDSLFRKFVYPIALSWAGVAAGGAISLWFGSPFEKKMLRKSCKTFHWKAVSTLPSN
jgi:hypothetical protein